MSEHVIDLRPECKLVQQICESDGAFGVSTRSIQSLKKLDIDYINEHFGSLLQDRYDQGYKDGRNATETQAHDDANKQGLEDAWEYAKKIVLNPDDGGLGLSELNEIFGFYTLQSIFKNYTVQQAIEKLKAYEKEQKANNTIKVGDEVISERSGNKGILLEPEVGDTFATVIVPSERWRTYCIRHADLKKTGKHYNIEGLLKVMNGVKE